MTLQDTSNGFIVHWLNYQTNVYNLAFYDFGGSLRKIKDITGSMGSGSNKGAMPIDYNTLNGLFVIDQNASSLLKFDSGSFGFINKKSIQSPSVSTLPSSFTQKPPILYDFDKYINVSLYSPNYNYSGDMYVAKLDFNTGINSLASKNLKQSSQSSTPLLFKDNANNFYAIYYSVNVAVGGDTITFTVYKNNLNPKTFTLPIKDLTTNGAGVQAGAMVGKYNIVDNCIYFAIGYELGALLTLSNPMGITVDANHIYVTDADLNIVAMFDLNGNYQSKFNVGKYPKGITLDANYLYVVNSDDHNVSIYDKSGNLIKTFGSFGSGNGQFKQPSGIAVDNTYIYVADTGNYRVQIFDLNGNYQSKFNSGDYSPDSLWPSGIAVNASNIYVTLTNVIAGANNHVEVYNHSGVLQFTFGSFGSGNGQFTSPVDIKVDSSHIYVCEYGNNGRVQIFDLSGNYQSQFNPNNVTNSDGIAISATNIYICGVNGLYGNDAIYTIGSVYVSNFNNIGQINTFAQLINVYRYDCSGSIIELFSYYNKTDPTVEPIYPVDISWDYNKKIYLAVADLNITANTGTFKIIRLDTSSSYTLIATVDTFTSVTDLDNQNFFSITDFYTQTNLGSAVATGVYLTQEQQDCIPYYKLKVYNSMTK